MYLERFLKSLISDVERRIKRGQERLRITQGDPNTEGDPYSLKVIHFFVVYHFLFLKNLIQ